MSDIDASDAASDDAKVPHTHRDGVCYPSCENGKWMMANDPRTGTTFIVPLHHSHLKDCRACREREWTRQELWLSHLWIADEARFSARRFAVTERPDELWMACDLQASQRTKMRQLGQRRGAESFSVFFEGGRALVVASENLSPRDGLMKPCHPLTALHALGDGYTSDAVRRQKGRSITDRWDIEGKARLRTGPVASAERMRQAEKGAELVYGSLDGMPWADRCRVIRDELRQIP